MGPMLSDKDLQEAADQLYGAERDRSPIDPLHDTYSGADIGDAYQIQLINIARRVREGAQVRGNKVGLTAKVMQEMLGVNEPDYGHIMSDMLYKSGDSIAASTFCSPKIEVEIAFVLKAALKGPDCTPADVFPATEFVVPVFELIDSRVRDWKIQLFDTIADNASAGGVVLGDTYCSPIGLDLAMVGALLDAQRRDRGDRCRWGGAREPGQCGRMACQQDCGDGSRARCRIDRAAGFVHAPAINVRAGDTIRADIDRLGSVTVSFT